VSHNSGIIFRIKKYAIHDGAGIRTTVFFKGCPLNCWWCHNPEGIQMAPEICQPAENSGKKSETVGTLMAVPEVMAAVEKDVIFYDDSGGGVTFSGGEPLMQAGFLFALLDACRQREIHTVLDTSGYAPAETFRAALEKVDEVLFDLKIMDAAAHKKYTGVHNRLILDNFRAALKSGKQVQVRFPVIPGITDDMENIDRIAGFTASAGNINRFDLLPFHRTAESKYNRLGMANRTRGIVSPSKEHMEIIRDRIAGYGFKVHVGG
jgi:pyruvate formate lyase activating enzyme